MMTLDSVSMLAGDGTAVPIAVVTMNGIKVPVRVAEVRTADFTNWSRSVTVAGAVAVDIPANAARKGGEIRAPLGNTGVLTLTVKKPDGVTTYVKTLEAGSIFSMIINPGFVLPHEITISGTTVGDTFEAVEYI